MSALVLAELRKRAAELELRSARLEPIAGQPSSRAVSSRYWERKRVRQMATFYRELIAWAEARADE